MRTHHTYPWIWREARRAFLAFLYLPLLQPTLHADYQSEILSENPLVYYRFNDAVTTDNVAPPAVNSGSAGVAGNGPFTGTVVNDVAGALVGSTDTALQVTGLGVSVPFNAALNNEGSFTVETWIKPDVIPAAGGLLCPISSWLQDGGGQREGWLIYHGDAATGFNFRTYNRNGTATAASISSGAGVTAGQWYHVVATWDDSAAIAKLYVNGVLEETSPTIVPAGTATRAYEANTTGAFTMGARSDNGFGWTGGIDDAAYYNTVLTDAQILGHYNNGISPSPSPAYNTVVLANSPVGYWRLNEDVFVPRTPPLADNLGTLGSSADGGYVAGAKNSTSGPSPASGFGGFGANNSCLTLPNENGFVTSNQQLLNGRTAFTVMGWVKRGATHSIRGGYFGQNDLLEFGDAGGGTQIEAWSSASGQLLTDAPYPFADDQWGFITYVADGTKVQLYLNGVQVKSVDSTVTNYGSSAFNFNIGGGGVFNATGDFFRGEIDEVAIFGHAVTPGRVQQLYDAALSNTGPGLVDTLPAVTPSTTIPEGSSYTLSIDATGSPPFTYEWKVNDTVIPGSNSNTYTVATAVPSDPPGIPFGYSVTVTNGAGTVSSDVREVMVVPTLRWTGTDPVNPGDWNIGISQNWKTFVAGTASLYSDEYAVLFDDTAPLKTVELTQDVTPVGVRFDNDTNYTLTGDFVIGGQEGSVLTKDGTGSLEIGNFAVTLGTVVVNDGILRVGNGTDGTLSAITSVSMLGGELQINQGAGTTYDSPTVMAAGSTLSVTGSGDLLINGGITGPAGDQVFERNGLVVVNGANTAGGNVMINSGTVAFDGAQQSNRLAPNATVTVVPGATMEVRGVNGIPGGPVNSVNVILNSATLGVVSGGSDAVGLEGESHAHIKNLTLNQSQVVLSYSGAGGAYNGESFQLNGGITVSGSAASTIGNGTGATPGNTGIALLAVNPAPVGGPAVHTFSVPDVVAGIAPDLIISTDLENSDAAAADTAASSIMKTGTGTLRLAGAISHGYVGTLNVAAGTLEATGSVTGPLVLASGTTFRPGTSVGTFGAGSTTLGGVFQCEIDGAVADKLVVNGNLAVQAGAQIAVTILSPATAPYYEICRCSGDVTGGLPGFTGVPAGYTPTLLSNSSILLVKSGVSFPTSIAAIPLAPGGLEDFSGGPGGFSIGTPVSPEADWTYTAGAWRSNAQASAFGADNTSYLTSPVYVVTQAGPVTLSFSHRYSFEQGFFDGGAVDVKVNGGEFTRVPAASFSQNGYNGTVLANSDTTLEGEEAFVQNSAGHPAFISSVCTLGNLAAGDRVQVRFISSSDNNTSGNLTPQGWEIDLLTVSGARASLMTLAWPVGKLEWSDNLQPPWTFLPATSPMVIDANAAPRRFFRIKP